MASIVELTGFHPCDRCRQRSKEAWYRKKDGRLFTWCNHHARQYEVEIHQLGFRLIMIAKPEEVPAS